MSDLNSPPSSPPPHPPSNGFLRARFARDHYLGLPLTTGIVALVATSLLFALVAIEVSTHGALTVLDQQLADWFNRHAVPPLTRVVLGYTHLHGTIGVLVMGALLAWRIAAARQWHWLLNLIVVLPGGMLFNYGLKHVFARARPHFNDPILVLHSYSFPSGHTIGAALLYAVLAAYIVNQPRIVAALSARVAWRPTVICALVIATACLLTALTGFSRVYLGAHFLSDVLAASLLGVAWFALWTTVVFTARGHYSARMRSN